MQYWRTQRSWLSATAYGNALKDAGQFVEACTLFRAATELDPSDSSAWVDLGEVLTAVGERAEAILAYREALRRTPGDQGARAALTRLESG
jgi:Flp pilus assembly protein TadD